MAKPRKKKNTEFCNMCGRSVAPGSGWFVNRVPDLDTPEERKEGGRLYPAGDWLCAECDGSCPHCDPGHSRHPTVLARAERTRLPE